MRGGGTDGAWDRRTGQPFSFFFLCFFCRVWPYFLTWPERSADWFETPLPYDALGGMHAVVGEVLLQRCQLDPASPMQWLERWQALADAADLGSARSRCVEVLILFWYLTHSLFSSDGEIVAPARRKRGTAVYRHRPMQAMLKGKISVRSQDGYTHLHNFRQQRRAVAMCDHCERKIWGFAGWYCVDCGVTCHDKCRMLIPPNCQQKPPERLERRAETFSGAERTRVSKPSTTEPPLSTSLKLELMVPPGK